MTKSDGQVYEVKSATISLLGRLWEENYKQNLPRLTKTRGVKKLFNRFNSLPAVLVGAGPSLDKNVHLLPHVKGKAVIISCDAALKVLLKHSVIPDIVVNLDPQSTVLNFFEGVDSRNITLVAPTIASPKLCDNWRGNLFFYNKFAPDIPALAQMSQRHPELGALTPGGTVLSIAFDLAFKMGADPIAFIGQDLSYPERNAYAAGSHFDGYAAKDIIDLPGDNIVEENDIFGRKLKTHKAMSVTKQWFDWAFKTWDPEGKKKIFNCSESGILTEIPFTSFREFASRYCIKKFNVPWIIKKAAG